MVTDEHICQLDLSSIKMAMNGAEPIRPETMANFAARFASTGFDAHSFTPGYGMAEATLTVSHKPIDTDYCCLAFNPMALAAGKAILDPQGCRLVSSGHVVRAWQLQIVDPQTCQPLPEANIGEVWVRGGSVAGGIGSSPNSQKPLSTIHWQVTLTMIIYVRGSCLCVSRGTLYLWAIKRSHYCGWAKLYAQGY